MKTRHLALGLLLSSTLAIAACGNTSTSPGADQGGNATGGNAAGGNATGDNGPLKPGQCSEAADCESFGDCSTLAELRAQCDDDLYSYATRCGGTYVEQDGGVTTSTWTFDSVGKLVAGSYEDEGSCEAWGSVACPPIGNPKSFCDAIGPECTSHDSCATWGFACPATLADVSEYCQSGFDLERFPSSCGGTVVSASAGVQAVRWTFDANGELVGAWSHGDLGDCDTWGARCDGEPAGPREPVCGTGGEGGSGGAGGSGNEGGGSAGAGAQ